MCYLSIFDDFTEAVAHRLAAEQCLDWDGCDSTSPAYLYMKEYLKLNKDALWMDRLAAVAESVYKPDDEE